MKIIYKIAILLFLSTVTVSCIRDELQECPPLRVNIAVKDKNYFNVDNVALEERKSENLPFREYVPTLFYTLRDLKTGEIVDESDVINVKGDNQVYTADFCPCIPHGTYILTVWGGMKDMDSHNDDYTSMTFHPEHINGRDMYLVNDTLEYTPTKYDYTVEMERVKGKLIIQAENLPEGIEFSEKSVNNLFGGVNHKFEYSGTTHVATSQQWQGNEVITKTILAPSISEKASKLEVRLHDGSLLSRSGDLSIIDAYQVSITMSRNKLTVVRYVWNQYKNDFDIYVLIDDNWEKVHGMQIEE
ncbi:MAG: hypothetical protein K2M93_00435 [Muribaculaceae bacterium]|nr:hypothetical protein [Muribaculaceae bacterium]